MTILVSDTSVLIDLECGNLLVAYERAMLDEQGGIAADRFDIQPGGRVLVAGEWVVVLRVTRREGKVCSLKVNRRFVSVVGIEEVHDYQAPSAEAAAAVKAATKLPPLTNYPGEGVLQITQAQWDKLYKDHKGMAMVKATETTGAHRRRQVENFVAGNLGHKAARRAWAAYGASPISSRRSRISVRRSRWTLSQ